jgi:valyl-tRNA synthetase
VEANRNFANKLWNAGRFVISAINSLTPTLTRPSATLSLAGRGAGGEGEWSLADSWIWARLQQLIRDVERLFQSFQYGQAGQLIYDFFWGDFADWYVEIAKLQLANEATRYETAKTLARVFDISMRLLHPFTPFVTEELWGHLRNAMRNSPLAELTQSWPDALIVASWPEPRELEGWEESKLAEFATLQEAIRVIRNLRAEKTVKPSVKLAALIVDESGLIKHEASVLAALSGLDELKLDVRTQIDSKPEGYVALVSGAIQIFLPLAELTDPEEERARLTKELAEAESHIARLEKLLGSDFANKAPAAVVNKEREKLAAYQETAAKLKAQIG